MIIYYQNQDGVLPEYDPETYELLSNWNPDLDYGNEYVEVEFLISTIGFDPLYHIWINPETKERWDEETGRLISSFGILKDSCFKIEDGNEKQGYLYAYPSNIHGVVLKNDVGRIANAISKMETSSIYHVELYDTVYDMSDECYEAYLKSKRNEIRYKIFDMSHTNRKWEYRHLASIAMIIADKIKKKRLGISDGIGCKKGATTQFVIGVAKEMCMEGYFAYKEELNEFYIRSLNKTEFKKSGLKKLEM